MIPQITIAEVEGVLGHPLIAPPEHLPLNRARYQQYIMRVLRKRIPERVVDASLIHLWSEEYLAFIVPLGLCWRDWAAAQRAEGKSTSRKALDRAAKAELATA